MGWSAAAVSFTVSSYLFIYYYYDTAIKGPSHGYRQHAHKISWNFDMWFFRYASVQTDILCTLSDGEVIDVDLTARADQSEDLSRGPLPLAYKRFMPPLGTKSTRSPRPRRHCYAWRHYNGSWWLVVSAAEAQQSLLNGHGLSSHTTMVHYIRQTADLNPSGATQKAARDVTKTQ